MFKRFSICYILLMFCITGTSAQEDRWTGNATNLSKGNLRVNSSGRYLEYSDGTPFLYMGDTAWELISRLNDKETELYLENRREKGFTVIQTVILDELDDMDVSSNGEPKLIDGNIDKPAPGYFTHVDKVISLADRTWAASPINLITWAANNGQIKMNLNLPAIIGLATQDGETPIDPGLISGITEALAKSNPIQLKKLLGTLNAILDNQFLGIIANMDDASFRQVFYLLTEGIVFNIMEEENGHTNLYLAKESTTAFIQLLPGLQPIVEGLLPESMASNATFKNLLGYLMANDENGLPYLWNSANTIDLGLGLLPPK